MPKYIVKTKAGPQEVSFADIRKLVQEGKLKDTMSIVSADAGQTWITGQQALAIAPDKPKKKYYLVFGIWLVAGSIVVSAARFAGIHPPRSDTGFSKGSQIGSWIGAAVGITIGIILIVKGLQAKRAEK